MKLTLSLIGLLVLAALLKIALLMAGVFPFNADEAVVGLMGRHILAGERPIFFYGQAYMGSLDAYLVAGGFRFFGQHIWVIRLVQILLYLGTVYTTYRIAEEIYAKKWLSLASAALMAIPTVNVTLYTTVSLGGYGEALLIGNLLILAALAVKKLSHSNTLTFRFWLVTLTWGFLAGLGLWANGLTLVFAIPSGIYLLNKLLTGLKQQSSRLKKLVLVGICLLAGFVIGSLPWWRFAWENGFGVLLHELLGGAVSVSQASWLTQVGLRLLNFILFGIPALLGMRPPWEVRWLVLPLIPFILAFWVWVVAAWIRVIASCQVNRSEELLLAGIVLVILAGFVFTPFGNDPSGRYFVPMAIPLSILAARVTAHLPVRFSGYKSWVIALICAFNLLGIGQCALRFPPGLTTQFDSSTIIDHRDDRALVEFLHRQGETRGYTTYWVAYPLAFISDEQLIFIPRLPYHQDFRYTARDDRYAPYRQQVTASPRVAYITANNPALDAYLKENLAAQGVAYQEAKIGGYRIFYALSAPIRPEALGFGDGSVPYKP